MERSGGSRWRDREGVGGEIGRVGRVGRREWRF